MDEVPNTGAGEHRVLVCGGRDYSDMRTVECVLDALDPKPTHIIEGGARGADQMGHDWAKLNGVDATTYLADWETHGRAAGPLRNQRMIDQGQPHLVVAFPGGTGTADMVRRAKAAGLPVIEVR